MLNQQQLNHYDSEQLRLSSGEIHYFWWFIQGSIMEPFTRHQLRHAWGFCERHAWGFLIIESSLRHNYFHGPAILYEDIIGIAHKYLRRGLLTEMSLRFKLKSKAQCELCELGYGSHSNSYVREDLVVQYQNTAYFKIFVQETERYWDKWVCNKCLGREDGGELCRIHFLDEISKGDLTNVKKQIVFISHLFEQLQLYARSFRWEYHDTETAESKASLLGAIGWCSGWRTFHRIVHDL